MDKEGELRLQLAAAEALLVGLPLQLRGCRPASQSVYGLTTCDRDARDLGRQTIFFTIEHRPVRDTVGWERESERQLRLLAAAAQTLVELPLQLQVRRPAAWIACGLAAGVCTMRERQREGEWESGVERERSKAAGSASAGGATPTVAGVQASRLDCLRTGS